MKILAKKESFLVFFSVCNNSAALARKFLLNQSVLVLSDRWMIETANDFVQKAGD
jgi:hypothetical protein